MTPSFSSPSLDAPAKTKQTAVGGDGERWRGEAGRHEIAQPRRRAAPPKGACGTAGDAPGGHGGDRRETPGRAGGDAAEARGEPGAAPVPNGGDGHSPNARDAQNGSAPAARGGRSGPRQRSEEGDANGGRARAERAEPG